jgi:hypothetical protein
MDKLGDNCIEHKQKIYNNVFMKFRIAAVFDVGYIYIGVYTDIFPRYILY